jgi:hypothetical protein
MKFVREMAAVKLLTTMFLSTRFPWGNSRVQGQHWQTLQVSQLGSVAVQAEAAHLCYLVAGVLPQVYEPGARMCLLGADHRGAPHTLASVAALQRTEILEWAKLPGAHIHKQCFLEGALAHAAM